MPAAASDAPTAEAVSRPVPRQTAKEPSRVRLATAQLNGSSVAEDETVCEVAVRLSAAGALREVGSQER
jgi:hypothetical protein